MNDPGLPIRTRSLVLRRFVPEDAEVVFALSNEEAARTWLPSQVYKDQDEAAETLEFLIGQYATPGTPREGAYVLAVEDRISGALIGHVGFSPFDDEVEIGFAIAQDYQRQGLATEAVAAAGSWALRRFKLRRILGIASSANVASRHTLLRAGFTHKRDEEMEFQGVRQAVSIYEWCNDSEDGLIKKERVSK